MDMDPTPTKDETSAAVMIPNTDVHMGHSAIYHSHDVDVAPAPVPVAVHLPEHQAQDNSSGHGELDHDGAEKPVISHTVIEEARQAELEQQTFVPTRPTDLEHYFVGPRDLSRHTKWPTFLRMDGSILPRLIIPLIFVAMWTTVITCISQLRHVNLGTSNTLLTVLGFVVGLALSFRSATAYERYSEGRKNWSLLIRTSRNIARTIWINIDERGEDEKQHVLGKLTAINLIVAYSVALKHWLRFEPAIAYKDLVALVGHINTFAGEALDDQEIHPPKKTPWKAAGEYLGLSFASSNPRKLMKRAKKPVGHLPLEILNHLSAYIDSCVEKKLLPSAIHQGQLATGLASLNEVLTETERVRDTPLPEAYVIAISQIAWIYILVLPFQLIGTLGWITIPGCIVSAYIILSLVAIGGELEDPFGQDVNDLPLDSYCHQIAQELEIITATPPPKPEDFCKSSENLVMYPLSLDGYASWQQRSIDDIRDALKAKVIVRHPCPSVKAVNSEQASTTCV